MYIGTLTGNSISFSSNFTFHSGDVYYVNVAFNPFKSNDFIVLYSNVGTGEIATYITGTLSGATASFDTSALIQGATDRMSYLSSTFCPTNANNSKFVITYREGSDTDDGKAQVAQMDNIFQTSNLTSNLTSNFIGISDGVYTDTSTATIQIVGATDDAQAGLTIGTQYVQGDGTLSSTPDATYGTVYAGFALSATELLIKA
jgi:hypothetical protein